MELLAILIALALYGLWGGAGVQRDGWFLALHGLLARVLGGTALAVAAVALPALLVAAAYAWLDDKLFGIAALVLLVTVLLFSFGRGNLGASMAAYLERWSRGDFHAAYRVLGDGADPEAEDQAISHPAQLHALARRRYYQRAFERKFAVLFWFMVLGPAGAAAYRLGALEAEWQRGAGRAAEEFPLLHWLDWIPARLLGISFALVGDFDACLYSWRALAGDTRASVDRVLESCGNAALRIATAPAEEQESAEALIARGAAELDSIEVMYRRALLVWLVIIALLTMIG